MFRALLILFLTLPACNRVPESLTVELAPGVAMEFAYIPPGTFAMGAAPARRDRSTTARPPNTKSNCHADSTSPNTSLLRPSGAPSSAPSRGVGVSTSKKERNTGHLHLVDRSRTFHSAAQQKGR